VVITAAMLIVGSILLLDQQLNIGQFVAAEIIIITVITSVEKIIKNLDKVYDVLTSLEKITSITEKPLEQSGSFRQPDTMHSGVDLIVKDLSFSYNDLEVFIGISFHAHPGQKVCIQGELGAGKSTLLRVLTGAYLPYSGSIQLDGISLTDYDLDNYRFRTGILLDDQALFAGTLMENITMGREDIPYTDIMQLSEAVGLKSFIDRIPGGLNMQVPSGGKRLPRKIIQKIQLVRALACKPRLLLMDEPWLVLEKEVVEQVKSLLLERFKDTTLIIVTNDASFADQCDQIIQLKGAN
jgi:ABC-type bacteriocin/lantibiotic exporter with double-glycine peptidase domain